MIVSVGLRDFPVTDLDGNEITFGQPFEQLEITSVVSLSKLSAMPRRDTLLPGVTTGGAEPMVVCDSRRVVARARRVAMARDAAQIVLLAGVDWLFSNWPSTHIPLLSRGDSLVVLGIVNVLILAHVWLMRALPKWSTRRIAATWCDRERATVMRSSSSARG